MKILKVLKGLLIDDTRLVSIVLLSLLLSVIAATVVHQVVAAALFIWLGLIGSLWVSIEHELKVKVNKEKG